RSRGASGATRARAAHAGRVHLRDRRFRTADVAPADGRRGVAVPGEGADVGDDRPCMAAAAMSERASVVYVVPDKLGGMMNIIANLLAHRRPDDLGHHVILTHNRLHTDTRFAAPLAADTQATVEYTLPIENLRAVMRRIARAVPAGGGVYVAGDLLDLAVAS